MKTNITPSITWREITPGGEIYEGGTSEAFKTGSWRSERPEWKADACRQCLLCVPVCPDSSIPILDGKRGVFDYDHCKGCGICAEVCSFGAILMEKIGGGK